MHPNRMQTHLSAVQRSLQNNPASQFTRLAANGTIFNKLNGLNGSTLRNSNSNSTPVNNSLLRFSVEALASSAADSAQQQQQRNEETSNTLSSALGENSKFDLSSLNSLNWSMAAARLGYNSSLNSVFGSGNASAFDNFAQLSNLNSQLNAATVDARNLFNNANNQNGSEEHQSDDEILSEASWDQEMINQDTEDEDEFEERMNQEEIEKPSKKKNKKLDFIDELQDDEDNIDIMDDQEK